MKVIKEIITEYYKLKITIESQDGRTHSMMDSQRFMTICDDVQDSVEIKLKQIEQKDYGK
jgi:hypothetical protein